MSRPCKVDRFEVAIAYNLLLLLQVGAAPVIYDTRAVTQACDRAASGDDAIIVCGRRDKDKYRIPALPADGPSLGFAETRVGGANVGVGTEQVTVGGFPSNRVMAKVKIPF